MIIIIVIIIIYTYRETQIKADVQETVKNVQREMQVKPLAVV